MDLRDLTRTFIRLWYLTAVVLIAAGGAAAMIWTKVGPTYSSTASLVLMPPTSVVDAAHAPGAAFAAKNPLLYLSDLSNARDVIVSSMTTPTLAKDMLDRFGAQFTLSAEAGSSAPIMVLTVEGRSAQAAQDGLSYLVSQVPDQIDSLQKGLGVTSADMVSTEDLAVDETPTAEHKQQIEYSVFAFVFMAAIGALGIALFDSRRSRAQRTAQGARETRPDGEATRRDDGPRSTRVEPGRRSRSDRPRGKDEARQRGRRKPPANVAGRRQVHPVDGTRADSTRSEPVDLGSTDLDRAKVS